MPNLLTRLLRAAPEAKASRALSAVAFYIGGRALWTPRDYATLAREGFQKNAVVHRSVRLLAEAAAAIPLTLMVGTKAADEHPLLAQQPVAEPLRPGSWRRRQACRPFVWR